MHNLLYYVTEPYAIFSVVVPWLFTLYWYATEGRRDPPSAGILLRWMVATVFTYLMSWWVIDADEGRISLHMIDAFFVYLICVLWAGVKVTPGAAYVLVFLCEWTVDMTRAHELVEVGLASNDTYYFGVGGAGMSDGLCAFPLLAAGLVHYVAWRQGMSKRK